MTWRTAVGATILYATMACAPAGEVKPGMSSAEVVRILGEPSRKAILDGKLLRELDELPAGQAIGDRRLVYFYDASGLQVWFRNDAVTGLVRDGVAEP